MLDASAAIELLLGTPTGRLVSQRVASVASIHAPHLIDIEVAQTLRRLVARDEISDARARGALLDWQSLDIQRYPHVHFMDRIWALRQNLTAYDAVYVALAEILDSPLLTGDRRLANAPGMAAHAEAFG